jgi:hypothetical protein
MITCYKKMIETDVEHGAIPSKANQLTLLSMKSILVGGSRGGQG